jgi:thiosulfate dehydrogenase
MKRSLREHWFVYLAFVAVLVVILFNSVNGPRHSYTNTNFSSQPSNVEWVAPLLDLDNKLAGEERAMVIYGEEIVANTAHYFGPRGIVSPLSNGMNCQNCHLDAGKQSWGNNYGAVFSTYPKFRERSGTIETIPKRVNDCFERSLNGEPIDTNSREMKSIVAYIQWLGYDVKKGEKPKGSGIHELAYLDRAADPGKGKEVYAIKCQTCHGANGEGMLRSDGSAYIYPPLWGEHSYNTGAGLYRISRFAGYIKDNMPFNQTSHQSPQLSDEEAWDLAAFVNSQPRPRKDISKDWPDISKKPVDHPFGPYHDGFSEQQHKYGPFKPIAEARKKLNSKMADTPAIR